MNPPPSPTLAPEGQGAPPPPPAHPPKATGSPAPQPAWRRHWAPLLAAALALGACAAAISVAVPQAVADITVIRTRWHIDQWASGKAPQPSLAAWAKARDAISTALHHTPNDPHLHENLGYLYASRAQLLLPVLPELGLDHLRQALISYHQAAQLRPMSGNTWANVALASHLMLLHSPQQAAGSAAPQPPTPLAPQDTLWPAFDKAMAYGQREPSVQTTLAEIGYARWATDLSPTRQQALSQLVATAAPHSQPTLRAIAQRHGHQPAGKP